VQFSAHGVPKSVPAEAQARQMLYLDATCPLVSKVHVEAQRHYESGREIVLIGHAGHPEVVGTMGQLPDGAVALIETVEDAQAFTPRDAANVAFVTQTTLSVDDTAEIVATLKRRFPSIQAPRGEDICYATSNRQAAVKAIAPHCDAMLVIGAPNSSNSQRLVEVAARQGVRAKLIRRAAELDLDWLSGVRTLGISAGASAPELLVRELVDRLADHFQLTEREVSMTSEDIVFKLPRALEIA
jgi:4-hydroxy-3-methylbut-2-enyl diphosphate reductase